MTSELMVMWSATVYCSLMACRVDCASAAVNGMTVELGLFDASS